MSDNTTGKSPLLNLAATVIATVTCCTTDVKEQNTEIHHNNILGPNETELGQKVIRSTSNTSVDVIPQTE